MLAMMNIEEYLRKEIEDKETEMRIKKMAEVLSHLPEEELEALRKKAEEGKHDGTNH